MAKDVMERNGWKFLTGDSSWEGYGACWYRLIGTEGWVLRFENKSEWGDGASGYSCEVLWVDLATIPASELDAALRCCGLRFEPSDTIPHRMDIVSDQGDVVASANDLDTYMAVLLDCCISYGIYGVLDSEEDPSYPLRARARARRSAEDLIADAEHKEERLARPYNAIGTTHREAAAGDSLAGLRRSAEAVLTGSTIDPSSALILRMYAAAGGQTLGGRVETELAVAGSMLKE